MTFPSKTILRFRATTDSDPYVAVVLAEGGNILEVKRGGVVKREIYSSVEEWLQSIDERPTVEQLEVKSNSDESHETDTKEPAAQINGSDGVESKSLGGKRKTGKKGGKEEEKEKEKEKEKKVKLNLSTSDKTPAVQWARHLHRIIKEAHSSLLTNQAVIVAFNRLVDVLLKHRMHVFSFVPSSCDKYRSGIEISDRDSLKKICTIRANSVSYSEDSGRYIIRSMYGSNRSTPETRDLEDKVNEEILEAYRCLFDLVKDHVVPYIHKKNDERIAKKNMNDMIRLSERIERIQSVYEEELKRRQKQLEYFTMSHEKHMASLREAMARVMTK
jgi:hypothetical protein